MTEQEFVSWWHRRTDGVEGFHKIIGEPGSMWREHVVKPLGLLAVTYLVGRWLMRKNDD